MNELGVNLFYEYVGGGPGKVIKNLIKGLEENNISCISNDLDNKIYYTGLLQSIINVHDKQLSHALCGPNLFVIPPDWGESCQLYSHYIVPSQWVLDKYRTFWTLDHATIDVWASGIDTEYWQCDEKKQNRCLIYYKNRRIIELANIINHLNSIKMDYDLLEYGYYSEKELFDVCTRCSCAILLTGTESQGIGYLEILSMNVPCFVCNKSKWDTNPHFGPFAASSVPYFDESCGVISDQFNGLFFNEFVSKLTSFSARKYVIDNFTLKQRGQEYYKLLQQYNCIWQKPIIEEQCQM